MQIFMNTKKTGRGFAPTFSENTVWCDRFHYSLVWHSVLPSNWPWRGRLSIITHFSRACCPHIWWRRCSRQHRHWSTQNDANSNTWEVLPLNVVCAPRFQPLMTMTSRKRRYKRRRRRRCIAERRRCSRVEHRLFSPSVDKSSRRWPWPRHRDIGRGRRAAGRRRLAVSAESNKNQRHS